MARARIISTRVHLPSGVVHEKGEEIEGPHEELAKLVDVGSAEWVEDAPAGEVTEQLPTFSSSAAAALAKERGLSSADFEGVEPSGKTGYTKSDVEAVLGGAD